MKKILCLVFLACALLYGVPAHAGEDATVNLYCKIRSGNKSFSVTGSGVFVSAQGVILTNAHVAQYFLMAAEGGRVKGQCHVRTGSPAKNQYTASVLYFPSSWIDANLVELSKKTPKGSGEGDFALLYITGTAKKKDGLPAAFPFVPISLRTVTEGESITVTGYPTGTLNAEKIKRALSLLTTPSTVSSVRTFSGASSDVFTIASSSAASGGISGGPVTHTDGTLAGIIVAKSDTLLRAITPIHMNALLVKDTGVTLPGMIGGNLAERAATNRGYVTPKQLIALQNALAKKR